MLRELKSWVRRLRSGSRPAYDIPTPVGSMVNTVSSWTYNSPTVAYDSSMTTTLGSMPMQGGVQVEDKREVKKPVEVVDRIVAEVPAMDLNNLDMQIKIVQRRLDLMREVGGNTRDEEIALVFLKARKKYKKVAHLFKWAVTNQAKIEQLCREYKVMRVDFGGYSRNVPQEGMEQIELYFEAWSQVSDKKPLLALIVDQGGKEQKKDPILLAQSPFGNWFYILGAWDKEVEIVDDLVYHNK